MFHKDVKNSNYYCSVLRLTQEDKLLDNLSIHCMTCFDIHLEEVLQGPSNF